MPAHPRNLMDEPAVCRLHAAESVALAQVLSGMTGSHGLYLGVARKFAKGLPRMGCWTRLRLEGECFDGSVRARADEALPFADDAFRVVVVSHVLEWTPHAINLLDEVARVLAPEGELVVVGFHPFSAWLPWLLCRRRPRPMLTAPGWVRQRLAGRGVRLVQVRRCGSWLPSRHGTAAPVRQGGGFVLVARKQRAVVMPLRSFARRQAAGRRGAWLPGTHRECA
ncbi:MAG TPA: methyltransferase domain-containing protein [Rhodanobacteraceae bacterium]